MKKILVHIIIFMNIFLFLLIILNIFNIYNNQKNIEERIRRIEVLGDYYD